MTLHNRFALITGAGKGLGKCIAEHFVKAGASVILTARTHADLESVKEQLSPLLTKHQSILTFSADVSSTRDVDALFAFAKKAFPKLNVLVNNAGVYGPFGSIDEVDWEKWVEALHINFLGTVYPCRHAVALFKTQGYGKIINLSGGGATSPLPRISAYASSKAAVVRFIETLALELKEYSIDVNAIAPGALATHMTDLLLQAGPEKVGADFYEKMTLIKQSGGTPLEKGAKLAVYLASSQSDGITGKLISAVWDPWEDLHKYREELSTTDIYTLRRIVPEERGKTWERSK